MSKGKVGLNSRKAASFGQKHSRNRVKSVAYSIASADSFGNTGTAMILNLKFHSVVMLINSSRSPLTKSTVRTLPTPDA